MLPTPELTFDEAAHRYAINGRPVPSVTQVIDWMSDYGFVKDDVMEHARQLGDAVHSATELYDLDNLDDSSVDPLVRPYLNAWIRFREETGFVPDLIEQLIYSKSRMFAGKLDRTGILRGYSIQPILLDIKSTATVMPTCGPQTAGYHQGLREMGYPPAVKGMQRYTIHLRDDGTYRLQPHKDPNDINIFLCSLSLHNWRNSHGT